MSIVHHYTFWSRNWKLCLVSWSLGWAMKARLIISLTYNFQNLAGFYSICFKSALCAGSRCNAQAHFIFWFLLCTHVLLSHLSGSCPMPFKTINSLWEDTDTSLFDTWHRGISPPPFFFGLVVLTGLKENPWRTGTYPATL